MRTLPPSSFSWKTAVAAFGLRGVLGEELPDEKCFGVVCGDGVEVEDLRVSRDGGGLDSALGLIFSLGTSAVFSLVFGSAVCLLSGRAGAGLAGALRTGAILGLLLVTTAAFGGGGAGPLGTLRTLLILRGFSSDRGLASPSV